MREMRLFGVELISSDSLLELLTLEILKLSRDDFYKWMLILPIPCLYSNWSLFSNPIP